VAVARIAKKLQSQQRAHGLGCRNHVRSRQVSLTDDLLHRYRSQKRKEEKQSAELRAEVARRQIQLSDIRYGSYFRTDCCRSIFVAPPGKPRKSLLPQNGRDRWRTQGLAALPQRPIDVVDRKILFAQGHDHFAQRVLARSRWRALVRGKEELPAGILTKVVTKDAEASRRVTEAAGGLGRRKIIDKVGSQGFILSMRGIRWLQEEPSHIC
jgi:hypothetical protein